MRVGIVSADLREHPVGYFLEDVLDRPGGPSFIASELVAYSNYSQSDATSERIKACCKCWHSALGISDEILARRIRDDGIDILIDLSGHTGHNRLPLFAWKPAPIQASWLGYFATTGVSAIDYLIADPWTLPESEEGQFHRAIWRLPETNCVSPPLPADAGEVVLSAFNNGYVTFGCFNNLTKINDDVVTLWSRVLQAVPDSRLFLKAKQFPIPAVQQNARSIRGSWHRRRTSSSSAPWFPGQTIWPLTSK